MKVISFYLPQFHQIPENDQWWGEGFTEWTNTKKTKPLFNGHNQPRTPLNENYYDLTNPSARQWQAEIAKEYNIYGFCYYHYWFNGKRLLEKPFNAVLESGNPDLPFCLAWANEPWTRSWDGKTRDILMNQSYGGKKEWKEHFDYLISAFLDPRYIKIDGKPVFLIYRPSSIENCDEMLTYWDDLAKENNLSGIYYIRMLTSFDNTEVSKKFSADVEFEPMYTLGHDMPMIFNLYKKARNLIRIILTKKFSISHTKLLNIIDYEKVWERIISRKRNKETKTYYGAFVDWDNTPRKGREGLIMKGASPEKFEKYFSAQVERAYENNNDFIFINAWNEWAEGTYLEPDKKNGFNYLEVIKKVINKRSKGRYDVN